ncbi:MAG: alpha-D-ribose 1-methylphosphonate 5-triphosphate diphosphatase [Pseudomonadota bacterium]
MTEALLRADRIVTPDGVIDGHLHIREGSIHHVETGDCQSPAMDWTGDVIIPGLIDIHTDNLEKHYMPRQNAQWDAMGAAIAHDGQMATAGVTTVLDSLSLHGRSKNGLNREEALAEMIKGLDAAEAVGALRVDHGLHLRCEVANPNLFTALEPHLDHPQMRMLSVMDHTPGARSVGGMEGFMERWRERGRTQEELDDHLEQTMSWRDTAGAGDRRAKVAKLGQEKNLPVASHDDASVDHISEAVELGCTIAEFPVSLEAAKAARKHQLVTVMGAPNFVRGRSHGANVSARDIANAGVLDALCSDYVPQAMIRAAFMLAEHPFNWPLQDAIATVTAVPAAMSFLYDRGTLEVGKRADLLRVSYQPGHWPILKEVWRGGIRVA